MGKNLFHWQDKCRNFIFKLFWKQYLEDNTRNFQYNAADDFENFCVNCEEVLFWRGYVQFLDRFTSSAPRDSLGDASAFASEEKDSVSVPTKKYCLSGLKMIQKTLLSKCPESHELYWSRFSKHHRTNLNNVNSIMFDLCLITYLCLHWKNIYFYFPIKLFLAFHKRNFPGRTL